MIFDNSWEQRLITSVSVMLIGRDLFEQMQWSGGSEDKVIQTQPELKDEQKVTWSRSWSKSTSLKSDKKLTARQYYV